MLKQTIIMFSYDSPVMTKQFTMKKKGRVTTKVQDVETKLEYCEMYTCLRRLMRITRWFGLFPLEGLESMSISGLKFNVKCLYGFYIMFSLVGQLMMAIISFWGLISSQLALAMLSHSIFYSASFASTVLLIVLAKNWPILMKEIAEIEREVGIKWERSLNIFRLSLFIMLLGVVEHLFCYIYVINFAMKCLQDFRLSYDVLDLVFTLKLQFLIQSYPQKTFHFVAGLLFEFTNAQAVTLWNLVDLLVMAHSIYLGAYFRELNKLIETEKNNKLANWGKLRYQHARLVTLVKKLDEHLSFFVLISFSTNLYFIVVQLFNSLRTPKYDFGMCDYNGAVEAMTGVIHGLFYVFSFVFLTTRTLIVSIMTANVHTYAFQPINALGEVHASMYDMEIQRFYRQITYTTIGVNGVFFYVTRGMILKVLGTLITYELVLLQFTHDSFDGNSTTIGAHNSTRQGFMRRITFNF